MFGKKKKIVNILWFEEVGSSDIGKVGGKGANLGELLKAKIPVPNGFIVTAQAYFDFLEKAGLKNVIKGRLSNINPENIKELNKISKAIKDRILKADFPKDLEKDIISAYLKLCRETENKYVAVRSSATAEDLPDASFAGQQATFLNISGENKLIKSVKQCWASLFEPRAIYYRTINKFDHMKVGIAVPVQEMVQSEVSGILFTIDPVTNNREHIMIDAGYGLGEAVVSGSITPDKYLVNKKDLKIISKEVHKQTWKIQKVKEADKHVKVKLQDQEKQKLDDKLIIQLSELGKKIEKYYKKPQDTEWAMAEGKIYFVQSRPVTTMKKQVKLSEIDGKKIEESAKGAPEEKDIMLKGAAASIGMASGLVNIIHSPKEIDKISKGEVLVTEMTTPDYVPAMKKAKAIVTDTGGRTCHAAIVSRELGVPCVVGTGKATSVLKHGQMVTVDGARGVVYKGKFEKSESKEQVPATRQKIALREEVPVTGTKLYVNLAEVSKAQEIAQLPVDGVGLLRAEFMIAEIGKHPMWFVKNNKQDEFVTKLTEGLKTFTEAFSPRPVIYRATDFKTNEYKNLEGGKEFEEDEENPMIGFRGCYRYIKQPEVFAMELDVISYLRDKLGFRNLHLMVPFVRTVSEFEKVKAQIDEAGLTNSRDFKLYMMVEVPSNVILIDKFLDVGVDGVSIGSNDLTQLTLGIDRDSAKMAEEFDERDEAVLTSINHVIRKCRKRNVTVSICGQAPSTYPEYTEFLVKAGITSISVNPDMIINSRRLIASIERKIILNNLIKR